MQSHARIEGDRSARLAVAVVLAVFGGIVGVGLIFREPGHDAAAAPSASVSLAAAASLAADDHRSSSTPTTTEGVELAMGGHELTLMGRRITFVVSVPGWRLGDQHPDVVELITPVGDLVHVAVSQARVTACRAVPGRRLGPSAAELADAIAAIPGTDVRRYPAQVGGLEAVYLKLTVRDDFRCGNIRFQAGEGYRDRPGIPSILTPGTRMDIWTFDAGLPRPVVIDGAMSADWVSGGDIWSLVGSMRLESDGGPPWLDGPPWTGDPLFVSGAPPPEAWEFPPPGALTPGRYTVVTDRDFDRAPRGVYGFGIVVPSPGWESSGTGPEDVEGIIKRVAPPPEGAVIRISSPVLSFATDPCGHELGPRVDGTAGDLAAAIARIPGARASGASQVALGSSTTMNHVVLTIPKAVPCGPGGLYLWQEKVAGGWAPPRTAFPGSTLRIWVFNQDDRPDFPRILVEAETSTGASPELEREIDEIVHSIHFYGG